MFSIMIQDNLMTKDLLKNSFKIPFLHFSLFAVTQGDHLRVFSTDTAFFSSIVRCPFLSRFVRFFLNFEKMYGKNTILEKKLFFNGFFLKILIFVIFLEFINSLKHDFVLVFRNVRFFLQNVRYFCEKRLVTLGLWKRFYIKFRTQTMLTKIERRKIIKIFNFFHSKLTFILN